MDVAVTRNRVLAAFGVVFVALLAWAWVDGGREPLRTIVQPIPVPGAPW